MTDKPVLFEISWEVCNKVGGIHTVLSTKAKTATARYGDEYIAVGPWLLSESEREVPFDDEPGYEEFCDTCRSQGIPVRVGRWRTMGAPRTILVEFSRLYELRDDLLAELWENYQVDSISGGWDYCEPVLFGHAAGMAIERWCDEYLAPKHRRAVVHAHEWMTGSSLLYLKGRMPDVGTVFTTHATMLGRALSSLGHSPSEGLGDKTAEELAEENGVVAKHSLEGVCARQADVFTTVSQITADEAELLHERRPDPVLPNGIDLEVMDRIAGDNPVAEVRARLVAEASRFVGEDVSAARFFCVSGRYEFHNKGIDVILEALAALNGEEGAPVLLFVLVPAGNSGLRSEVLERRDQALEEIEGPVGISTHHLFDEENDPVRGHCERFGLDNQPGSRVKVMQVPIYLDEHDGFLNLPYEAVLRAMDLACFPSYYEPWGYTPQESLAVGVPTITSDYAGFGRWAEAQQLGAESGITVLSREKISYPEVVKALAAEFRQVLASGQRVSAEVCRSTASRTEWADLYANYERAYALAGAAVEARAKAGTPKPRRPRKPLSLSDKRATQPRLSSFDVVATIPKELSGLQRLAHNYWWCWDGEATALFAELDPENWTACRHNPVALLQTTDAEILAAKAADAAYLERVAQALARFEDYVGGEPGRKWPAGDGGQVISAEHPVAYFSAEFGLHESLPIYSGGLGVLAGDHLKSASDLGLPLVGIGLFYRGGYMEQVLTSDGGQTEIEVRNDPRQLPMEAVRNVEGQPLEVHLKLPGRELSLRAWRVRVGSVSLYLLDADVPSNREEDRGITARLYGGDEEMRLLQEIVLGRGGTRLLRAMGLHPSVYHMNEGHAALLSLERVTRLIREEGLTFCAAQEIVRATTVFTTHTPVPAGHDRFAEDLIRRYFSDAEEWVGLPWDGFYALGRDGDGMFNMTHLAMSFASHVGGVSKLHGRASKKLLQAYWPGLVGDEYPIHSITNGIHLPTWSHPRIVSCLGRSSTRPVTGAEFAEHAAGIDPAELWAQRQVLKKTLVERATASLSASFAARSDSPIVLHGMLEGLDPDALLIGFARRFAPYKRAHLMFQDLRRLQRILSDSERPVRILIAGKAHPKDQHGKDILQEIAALSRGEALIGKVLFLENYNMDLARSLVQGVDVWLNNPTRMMEASGTSGMKSAANGGLNLSIGDGWWPEAADGRNGWTIGGERVYENQELQDQLDSTVLYRLLEEEIVPMFFDRDAAGVPGEWVARMQHNLATIPPVFNTGRMVQDYFDQAYSKQAANYFEHVAQSKARPKQLGERAKRIRQAFGGVEIVGARIADLSEIRVGEAIDVHLDVHLGQLSAEDVLVEFVVGRDEDGVLCEVDAVELRPAAAASNGTTAFEGAYPMDRAGRFSHGLRVRARHAEPAGGPLKDLVIWV